MDSAVIQFGKGYDHKKISDHCMRGELDLGRRGKCTGLYRGFRYSGRLTAKEFLYLNLARIRLHEFNLERIRIVRYPGTHAERSYGL